MARRRPRLVAPDAWRQSSIARFDACPLSLQFDMETRLRQLPGAMGQLGARGTLAHRTFAAALNHMREHGERKIPVDMMMELLARVIAQRDHCTAPGEWASLPPEDVVHLRMSELRWLRVLATRWAYQHEFSIDRVVAVEERLTAPIDVRGPDDTVYRRFITGQPDVLLAGPRQAEATVLDYKTGWAGPAAKREPTEEEPEPEDKLSEQGYVQQTVYGWLVMKTYPAIDRVTLREFYVMADEDPVREATVERWEIERIEDVLAAVISQMDAAVEGGRRSKRWIPVPGTHCGTCVGRRHCPVREEYGIPVTPEDAQLLAREWHVGGEIRKDRTPLLKGWIDAHGPVPIAHAKGRRVVGYKNGSRSLSMFEPKGAAPSPFDPALVAVAREADVLDELPA